MKRRLLARAVQDLVELETYLATENPQAAETIAAHIRKSFGLIAERLEVGRTTHRAAVHERLVPGLSYAIPYRMKTGTVEILRIFHSRGRRPDEW